MNVGGSGNIFDLQGTISVDTSSLKSSIQAATGEAESLSESLSGITDKVDVDVIVDDNETADTVENNISGITDNVSVEVDVDDGGTAEDVANSITDIGNASGNSEGSVGGLQDLIINGLAGAATIGAIDAVISKVGELSSEISNNGDRIDKQSQILGISREAFQEWDYVLAQNGINIESLGVIFKTLGENVENGGDDFKKALDNIGLSYDDVKKMSTEDAFDTIVKAMQDMGDYSGKNADAMDLFGKKSTILRPLLNSTSKSVKDLKEQAHELGMIMSDEDIDAAVNYKDALDTFNRTVTGLKNSIADELLPSLTGALDTLSKLIGNITDESLTDGLERIHNTYLNTMSDIESEDAEATAIIEAIRELEAFGSLTEEQTEQWNIYRDKLLEIMPELGTVFEAQSGKIQGTADALTEAKDNLILLAKQEADYIAQKSLREEIANAQAELSELKATAKIAQNEVDTINEKIESGIRGIADDMGETFNLLFEDSLKRNTDEQGITDWAAVYQDLFTAGNLKAWEEADEEMLMKSQLIYDYFGQRAEAEKKAKDAQEELTKKTEEYDKKMPEWELRGKYYYEFANETEMALRRSSNAMDDAGDSMDDFSENMDDVKDTMDDVSDSMDDMSDSFDVSDTADSNLQTLSSTVSGALDGIWSTVKNAASKIGGGLSNLFSAATGKPKKYAVGIDYVPSDDMPALLHQGEAVLTKAEATNWRKGGNSGGGISSDDIALMANTIASAVSRVSIPISIGATEVATSIRNESTRQNAYRTNQVNKSYGNSSITRR